jgi:hypothetical protein
MVAERVVLTGLVAAMGGRLVVSERVILTGEVAGTGGRLVAATGGGLAEPLLVSFLAFLELDGSGRLLGDLFFV